MFHNDCGVTAFFAMIALASSPDEHVELSYIDTLPPPESGTFHCVFNDNITVASARVLLGELLEREERYTEAAAFASADLQVGGGPSPHFARR